MIYNGHTYKDNTPLAVIHILEGAYSHKTRIHIHYGDTSTGKDWNEESFIEGYIYFSRGKMSVPLMVCNTRSLGGTSLLDDRIVKISLAKGGDVLYQHPLYQPPVATVGPADLPDYSHNVYLDGQLYGRCHSEKKAHWLARWMTK